MTALLVCLALTWSMTPTTDAHAQSADKAGIEGAWTLNRELSDAPPSMSGRGEGREGQQRGYGGHGGKGMGHGGMGGHGMIGGGGGGGASMDPEQAARMREAMHDIIVPPDSLTIVQTDSTIVLTSPDGRTTRLSPDGKKVTDENTRIERKTKWDGGKLVSEISGARSGRITQTFVANPETRQLRLTVVMETRDSKEPRSMTYVYDAATR
jgi:hypothetical protein